MTDLLQAARLTTQMVAHRDEVRRIFGDRYVSTVKPFRLVIRGLATEGGISLARAGLHLCKDLERNGHDPILAIAATVDEMESLNA